MIGYLRRLLHRRNIAREMEAEMEFHRQARVQDLMQHQALPAAEANRQARLEFGSASTYREEARAALGLQWFDQLRGDLLFTARGLRRTPGFAIATVGILTLAIGVNAAFFSLFSNYALRPLPIRNPQRHFSVEGFDQQATRRIGWTPAELPQLQAATHDIEGIYSASGLLQVLLLAPTHRQSMVVAVTANYFPLLGGAPAVGRIFTEAEDRQPVAVLSDAGWKRLFPAHASPIGQSVRVRSTWFTVVGLMPPTFTGTEVAVPDLWVPSGMRSALRENIGQQQRASLFLRPGASVSTVETALSAVAARLPRDAEDMVTRVRLRPDHTYLSAEVEDTGLLTTLLFAVFLLVLLIACANLANLFLARTMARTQEIRMRFALGAGRWRIIRQLLTESTVLALVGAAAGLGCGILIVAHAHAWLFSIASASGAMVLPLVIDWRIFLYAVLLGLLAGSAFGLLPALNGTSVHRQNPGRLRNLLLSGQVAASVLLLVLATVLVRNAERLDSLNTGYSLRSTFDLQLDRTPPQVLARLRTFPGVDGVSAVERVPLFGRLNRLPAHVGSHSLSIAFNYVDEHYFQTLGIPIIAGRGFARQEAEAGLKVALISQSTAQRLWPDVSALGHTISIQPRPGEPSDSAGAYQIIGIVPDVINGFIFEGPEAAVLYLPGVAGQDRLRSAIIRFRDASPAALKAIREQCAIGVAATGCDPKSLYDIAAMQRFPFQAAAWIAGGLGLLALLLTVIGLFSVVSYTIVQRRRDIGVMVAIGAQPHQVTRSIVSDAARCFLRGLLAALPLCLVLSKLAASTGLQLRTFDPVAYCGVPALLAVVAGLACLVPVRRALRIQPMAALRQD